MYISPFLFCWVLCRWFIFPGCCSNDNDHYTVFSILQIISIGWSKSGMYSSRFCSDLARNIGTGVCHLCLKISASIGMELSGRYLNRSPRSLFWKLDISLPFLQAHLKSEVSNAFFLYHKNSLLPFPKMFHIQPKLSLDLGCFEAEDRPFLYFYHIFWEGF